VDDKEEFTEFFDRLTADFETVSILLKMVFGIPAADAAVTVRQLFHTWRNHEVEDTEVIVKPDTDRLVTDIWKRFNRISDTEQLENLSQVMRRIMLVKLHAVYCSLQFAFRRKNYGYESQSRTYKGKAMVRLEAVLTTGLFDGSVDCGALQYSLPV
jgi:hypothetical protein